MFDIISLIGVANSINIRLRVTASEGVILFVGGDNEDALSTDYLLIGVDRGYLQVHELSTRPYCFTYGKVDCVRVCVCVCVCISLYKFWKVSDSPVGLTTTGPNSFPMSWKV